MSPETNLGSTLPTRPARAVAEPVELGLAAAERRTELFCGPLPDPAAFARYEAVLPGAAERILALAEREMAHRHALDQVEASARQRSGQLGVWLGFCLTLAAVGYACLAGWKGDAWTGAAVTIGAIATLWGSGFIRRRPRPGPSRPEGSVRAG